MPLDDATKALLDELAGAGIELTVDGARAFGAELARRFGAGPELRRHALTTLELVPSGEPRGVIVFFHGGGWVAGSPAEVETLGRVLADRTSCTVVIPEYRLAPEH